MGQYVSMDRYRYEVELKEQPDGWRAVVRGTARVWVGGPYPTAPHARTAVVTLVQRWRARAGQLGGRVWRPSGHEIAVALPPGCPIRDALPFSPPPCSVVAPPPAPASLPPHDASEPTPTR